MVMQGENTTMQPTKRQTRTRDQEIERMRIEVRMKEIRKEARKHPVSQATIAANLAALGPLESPEDTTASTKSPNATPGFAIEIGPDTNLGLAILLAEDEEGHSEPVAVVVSINEAREIAVGDMRRRRNELERGEAPMCPYEYKVWAEGLGGGYRVAGTIPATEV
jgi:hypothetical protein